MMMAGDRSEVICISAQAYRILLHPVLYCIRIQESRMSSIRGPKSSCVQRKALPRVHLLEAGYGCCLDISES